MAGKKNEADNNSKLHELWKSTGFSQSEALALLNDKQARPLGLSTFKAYMAGPKTIRRRPCPDWMLEHANKVLAKFVRTS